MLPHVIERTVIPTSGCEAHLGAAAYLAVLAYPSKGEWDKRTAFVEAWKACLLKKYANNFPIRSHKRYTIYAKYRKLPNQKINNVINNGVNRIATRRFTADRICREQIYLSPSAIRTMAQALGMVFGARHADVRHPKGNIRAVQGREAARHGGDARFPTAREKSRIWAESKPVLHLAMALTEECLRRDGFDPFGLVNSPDWVGPAIARAGEISRMLSVLNSDASGGISLNINEIIELTP